MRWCDVWHIQEVVQVLCDVTHTHIHIGSMLMMMMYLLMKGVVVVGVVG